MGGRASHRRVQFADNAPRSKAPVVSASDTNAGDQPLHHLLHFAQRTSSERLEGDYGGAEPSMFFTFPEDARWNADRQAVEFRVEIGEYQGVVRVPRRAFQRLLPERPTPERRGLLPTADPVRGHCRAEDPSAAVD